MSAGLATVAPAALAASSDVTVAQTALENGDFTRAKSSFARAAARDPGDLQAQLGVATIALYENRLEDAGTTLKHLLARESGNQTAASMLREVKEREGGPFDYIVKRYPGRDLPLAPQSALPLVHARINGGSDILFAIDTTAAGVYLSESTARTLGFEPSIPARLSSLQIGNGEIDGVPARVVQMNPRATAGEEPVAGVLGIAFLSHFFVTLDYAGRRLGLEPPRARTTGPARSDNPMWLCDDRHIFTDARLNHAPPALFNIDTGVTGGLLVTAESIGAAHITFDRVKLVQRGAVNSVRLLPFTASLTLDGHTFKDLDGSLLAAGTPTGTFPFAVGGTVGGAALSAMRLTFDFTNMQLTAAPRR